MAGPAFTLALLPSGALPAGALLGKDPADRLEFLLDAGAFLDAARLGLADVTVLQDATLFIQRPGIVPLRGRPSRGVSLLLDGGLPGSVVFVGLLLKLLDASPAIPADASTPSGADAPPEYQQLVVSVPVRVYQRLPAMLAPVPAPPPPAKPTHFTETLPFEAAADISGHRALMFAGNGVVPADPFSAAYRFAGISLGAAREGATVQVCEEGWIQEPTWSWTPGDALFVGPDGVLTTVAPTTGISQQVATAVLPDAINVQPFPPITLS